MMGDDLKSEHNPSPPTVVCGPCSLDDHDNCHWHDGDDCACSCHDGYRRFVGAVVDTDASPLSPRRRQRKFTWRPSRPSYIGPGVHIVGEVQLPEGFDPPTASVGGGGKVSEVERIGNRRQVIDAVVNARIRRMDAGIPGVYEKSRPIITRHVTQELEDIAAAGYRIVTICGMASNSGPNYEPLACGYPTGHEGPHSWNTLPTFAPGYRVIGPEDVHPSSYYKGWADAKAGRQYGEGRVADGARRPGGETSG